MAHFEELYFLRQCELRDSPAICLPSWVPDDSTPLTISHLHFINRHVAELGPSSFCIEGHFLQALGVRCGVINDIIPVDGNVQLLSNCEAIEAIRLLFSHFVSFKKN